MKSDPNYPLTMDGMPSHLNENLLTAIDVVTTGSKPGYDSIIQVCLLPLNHQLKPHKGVIPFYTDLKLKYKENVDFTTIKKSVSRERIYKCEVDGLDPMTAFDRLESWIEKVEFRSGKKVAPLSLNWLVKRDFLIDWLGLMHFDAWFDSRYRDPIPAALYANDKADHMSDQVLYPKTNLAHLCSELGIEHYSTDKDTLQNCMALAEIYRRMLCRIY